MGLDVSRGRARARGTDERFGYLAADDAARADDLMRAWCDPDVAAVFCGARRLRRATGWSTCSTGRRSRAAGPKVLVGFSDVTALHQAFAARLGLSTLHGPVVTSASAAATRSPREHLRSHALRARGQGPR